MNSVSVRSTKQLIETIRFGEFLYERQLIDDAQLLEALADHWSNGGLIGAAISRRGFLSPAQVEEQAALYHGLAVIELED